MSAVISEQTRVELEGLLMLLAGDIRSYRDREQQHLTDPTIAFSEMLLTVGKVKALRDVLEVIEKLSALYKPTPENAGKLAAGG